MLRLSLALAALLAAGPAVAHGTHNHAHTAAEGHFQDAEVAARPLSDWAGEWQSVYPLLTAGALDPVMAHKAEGGKKTAEEYRAYYETGYKTDLTRIVIEGDKVAFTGPEGTVSGTYTDDGHEILTYEDGHRAVRFAFRKTAGDAGAPALIVFSDHKIAPQKADHFHLYMGDDRAKLFAENINWPTFFPAKLSADEIVKDMMSH